jgi:hypothetical protein
MCFCPNFSGRALSNAYATESLLAVISGHDSRGTVGDAIDIAYWGRWRSRHAYSDFDLPGLGGLLGGK